MRFSVLSILGLLLMLGSLYFFGRGIAFAAERNYAAAFIAVIAGGCIVGSGRDLVRLAFLQK